MLELETPRFGIGSEVLVLSRHSHWGIPSLSYAVIMRITWSPEGAVSYHFAAWSATDDVVKIFAAADEDEAKVEFLSAVERYKRRNPGRE